MDTGGETTSAGPRILAGDIGGTKSLFGLFAGDRLLQEVRLANVDFGGMPDTLAAALDRLDRPAVDLACLAVAGPVADDGSRARLTNLPWTVDAAALRSRFGLPPVRLVNDFAAAAMGAVTAPAATRHPLQAGEALATAPHLVIGAGTGLGMAIVLPDDASWRILPGEGGHVAFAPADAVQAGLWQQLAARHGRVTWERVVSGPGLEAIYAHVCATSGMPATQAVDALAAAAPGTPEARALDLFLACYGAFAGDMALAVNARGGVHLAGGIAARILPAFSRGDFLGAFNAKAEHEAIARRMPVSICLDPAVGLRGAARLAAATP